jgi:hypothetical protein
MFIAYINKLCVILCETVQTLTDSAKKEIKNKII